MRPHAYHQLVEQEKARTLELLEAAQPTYDSVFDTCLTLQDEMVYVPDRILERLSNHAVTHGTLLAFQAYAARVQGGV